MPLNNARFPAVAASNRALMMTAGYLLFCVLYLGSPHLSWRAPATVPALRLDDIVPFMQGAVWLYLSQFGLLFCAIWYAKDTATRTTAFYAMLLASAGAAVIFIVFPTALPRATVDSPVWRFLYTFDVPGNCFPSLHAALALIAATALVQGRGLLRFIAPLWAAAIIFSALATKQHVTLDIAGGLVLGAFSLRMVRYFRVGADDHA